MKKTIEKMLWHLVLYFLAGYEGEGDGAPGADGQTGRHPASGSGSDDDGDDDLGPGLLEKEAENAEALKYYQSLSEEQRGNLELTDDQKSALQKNEGITFSDDQLKALADIRDEKSPGDKKVRESIEALKKEGIPEQFIDPKTGEIKSDQLVKSWKDTRKALEQKRGNVPKDPSEYKFEPTEELSKLSYAKDITEDDPAIEMFKGIAHALGLDNKQFNQGIEMFLTGAKDFVPDIDPISIEDEKKKLGAGADAVLKTVYNWGDALRESGIWSDDEFEEIVIMGSTATGMSALNKLREHYGGEKLIPLPPGASGDLPSKEELYAAVASEKYEKDPAYRAKIDQQFKDVFGTDPAGTSERGLGVK